MTRFGFFRNSSFLGETFNLLFFLFLFLSFIVKNPSFGVVSSIGVSYWLLSDESDDATSNFVLVRSGLEVLSKISAAMEFSGGVLKDMLCLLTRS